MENLNIGWERIDENLQMRDFICITPREVQRHHEAQSCIYRVGILIQCHRDTVRRICQSDPVGQKLVPQGPESGGFSTPGNFRPGMPIVPESTDAGLARLHRLRPCIADKPD